MYMPNQDLPGIEPYVGFEIKLLHRFHILTRMILLDPPNGRARGSRRGGATTDASHDAAWHGIRE